MAQVRQFLLRGLPTFLKHLGLLALGASAPTLSLVAGTGVEHLTVHDLWSWLDAEQAALALALLAWVTPLSPSYGVGARVADQHAAPLSLDALGLPPPVA